MNAYTLFIAFVLIVAGVLTLMVIADAARSWWARKDAELQAHIDTALAQGNSAAADVNIAGYGRIGREGNR